jgi:hypothetical protein
LVDRKVLLRIYTSQRCSYKQASAFHHCSFPDTHSRTETFSILVTNFLPNSISPFSERLRIIYCSPSKPRSYSSRQEESITTMHFLKTVAVGAFALASIVVAQAPRLAFTKTPTEVTAGQPVTIQYAAQNLAQVRGEICDDC